MQRRGTLTQLMTPPIPRSHQSVAFGSSMKKSDESIVSKPEPRTLQPAIAIELLNFSALASAAARSYCPVSS